MISAEAAAILRRFNAWRRARCGDPDFMDDISAREIGCAIEIAIAALANTGQASAILRRFNAWRRGGDDDLDFMAEVSVGEIGLAIDIAISALEDLGNETERN